MNIVKIITGVAFGAALLSVAACSQQEQAAPQSSPAAAPPAAEAVAETPIAATAQMTTDDRAAARAAMMERSASTEFATAPLIDPNTATEEELAAIPGLTETQVQAIIAGRPFATPSELHAAIGQDLSAEEQFAIYSAVFVKVNLNRGETADFLLVPSTMAPDRLAREFEEYRPYRTAEDFSREMKKYVSDNEVAFLERFVIID